MADTRLVWEDILVIVAYFAVVIAVGIWSSCHNRGTIGGYFLAGRNMHWILVGASLFASNIGSGHFVGLAGSGAASGIGVAVFELNAIFVLMMLGWLFVPVYTAAGVFTMPEYLRKRFGGQRIRIYLSCLALLLYIFTKISIINKILAIQYTFDVNGPMFPARISEKGMVLGFSLVMTFHFNADMYSGALFITQSIDINLYLAIIILLAISALFTVAGGLTAVIWTDFIQTVIMIIGAGILMVMSFVKVGGYEAMTRKYFEAWPNTTRLNYGNASYPYTACGIPPKDSMNFMRPVDDGNYPWTGMMFGLTISSVWYWCSDQVIVQRALAAKNITYAKAGCIVAGLLKFLPMWLIVFPGMIARILFPSTVGCADPDECKKFCDSKSGCTNAAFPTLVLELMPDGLKGLMLAVMMSALVSSLTSIFNSSSTIFTMDIWRRIRKNAGEMELMIVGRLCVIALVAIGVAWIPVVQHVSELFHYIQAITSFLAPPICAVYVLAIFWKRINEMGAFYGLMSGLIVGLIRFIWEYVFTVPPCGEGEKDERPAIIKDIHYLHFGCILFGIVFIVTIVVSLLTKPIDDCHLHRLTFWSRHSTEERIDISEDEVVRAKPSKETEDKKHPCYRVAFNWICGIEKVGKQPEMDDEQRRDLERKQNSIYEPLAWKRVTNVAAIALMVATTFFWGFYA